MHSSAIHADDRAAIDARTKELSDARFARFMARLRAPATEEKRSPAAAPADLIASVEKVEARARREAKAAYRQAVADADRAKGDAWVQLAGTCEADGQIAFAEAAARRFCEAMGGDDEGAIAAASAMGDRIREIDSAHRRAILAAVTAYSRAIARALLATLETLAAHVQPGEVEGAAAAEAWGRTLAAAGLAPDVSGPVRFAPLD